MRRWILLISSKEAMLLTDCLLEPSVHPRTIAWRINRDKAFRNVPIRYFEKTGFPSLPRVVNVFRVENVCPVRWTPLPLFSFLLVGFGTSTRLVCARLGRTWGTYRWTRQLTGGQSFQVVEDYECVSEVCWSIQGPGRT